jgi:hypothetical protein
VEVKERPVESSCSGSVGKGEFAKNVRIIFANGADYTKEECLNTCKVISDLFKSKVHYTYFPMTPRQVIRTVTSGKKFEVCKELEENVKKRIKKVTSPKENGAGRVIIIAHSAGGAVLGLAELSEEEKKRIQVVSFGSARLFRPGEFGWVKNIVARCDVIPAIFSALAGWMLRFPAQVERVGPRWQMPFASHSFLNKTYQDALKRFKEEVEIELKKEESFEEHKDSVA